MFVELHLISPATGKWPARSLETMTRIDRWYDTSHYWCVVTMCLSFFDTIMKCLSTDKHPTLHLVTPTKLQLVKTRTPTATDCASVRTICVINWTITLQSLTFTTQPHFHLDPWLNSNSDLLPSEAWGKAVASLQQFITAVQDQTDQTMQEPTSPKSRRSKSIARSACSGI